MVGTKGWRIVAVVAVVGIAAAMVVPPLTQRIGASSEDEQPDTAERCERAVDDFVEALQSHVDTVAITPVSELVEEPPSAEPDAQRYAQRLAALDCDEERADARLADELEDLRTAGAVSQLAADSVRSSVLGEWPSLEEVDVTVSDDLAAVLTVAPSQITLDLEAGEHTVSQPLVVRHELTLRGAGRGETRVESSADEVALLHAGSGALRVEGLTLAHVGSAPASVLVVDDGSYELADLRVTGGVSDDEGVGGAGLVLGPDTGEGEARRAPGRVAEITDVEVVGNEGAGVIVRGAEAPTLSAVEVTGSGACGVCFLGEATGELSGSRLSDNEIGVVLGDRADPLVAGNVIEGNRRTGVAVESGAAGALRDNEIVGNGDVGVLVSDDAQPTVRGNEIRDHAEAGVVLGGASAARLADNVVGGSPIAVWLEGDAAPSLEGNRLGDGESAGMVYAESSAGQAADNEVDGFEVGIEVRDSAGPDLRGNAVTSSGEAALLFRDDAEGSATGNRCDGGEPRIVLADAAATSLDGNDCRLDDLR